MKDVESIVKLVFVAALTVLGLTISFSATTEVNHDGLILITLAMILLDRDA